jgi:hypothetical protein
MEEGQKRNQIRLEGVDCSEVIGERNLGNK